jgi:hypothetical protein
MAHNKGRLSGSGYLLVASAFKVGKFGSVPLKRLQQ